MNKRHREHFVMTLAVVGFAAGTICLSRNQAEGLAGAHERAAGARMELATIVPWRADQFAEAGTRYQEEFGSLPKSKHDSFKLLDPSTERCIRKYGPSIKRYAERYGFDWRLVLAIMKQESSYSRNALSRKGAAGLMQLMPLTSEELARKLDLENLSHPEYNIQAGIFYLRELYNQFEGAEDSDRLKLTLAAYNAGRSRVHDAQELAVYLHDKKTKWQSIKDALPLLSKRFYTLHRTIWGQDKPRSGWFGNSGETIKYVDSVMDNYDAFRLALN